MTEFVKSAFDPLGLVFKNIAKGPSEAELASQAQQRSEEEQEEAELLARGPSRISGRGRKVGRQLLAFLGPTTTKSTTGRSGAREGRSFRGPGADRNRIR